MTGKGDGSSPSPTVAVIGGGLAGMAAAEAAAESGLRVELFEARQTLGGRVASFRDRDGGGLVDLCQHVGMGCCTNLADFCRRMGVGDCFRHQRRLHFIGPSGKEHTLCGAPLIPAPLHLAPGLVRMGYLSWSDRRRIGRSLARLARLRSPAIGDRQTIGQWLRRQGESAEALQRFWSPVLTSALSETLDRASLAAARKVLVDGFLANRRAYEMVVPEMPLREIFDRRVGERLASRGVAVYRGLAGKVRQVEGDAQQVEAVLLADGTSRRPDFVVVAVPWWNVRAVLSRPMIEAIPHLTLWQGQPTRGAPAIEPAPITAVHLWLDRPVTELANAALVGRQGQWIFRPAWTARLPGAGAEEHYCQVVISASHGLVGRPRDQIAGEVWAELCEIWPAARETRLVRSMVVTSANAVFSVRPGIDALRPPQATPVANLFLAGDWTATGWPATMESAVRSGYLAVEAILQRLGRPRKILVPDLPRSLLAQWLIGTSCRGSQEGRYP